MCGKKPFEKPSLINSHRIGAIKFAFHHSLLIEYVLKRKKMDTQLNDSAWFARKLGHAIFD